MSYSYDNENVFARILRGEIPNKTVLESEYALAFEDINPAAPVHVLVIPKGPYVNYDHFLAVASSEEIVGFHQAVLQVAHQLKIDEGQGGNGYRVVSNAGKDSHQEVPHLHFHILAGRPLGPLLSH